MKILRLNCTICPQFPKFVGRMFFSANFEPNFQKIFAICLYLEEK